MEKARYKFLIIIIIIIIINFQTVILVFFFLFFWKVCIQAESLLFLYCSPCFELAG